MWLQIGWLQEEDVLRYVRGSERVTLWLLGALRFRNIFKGGGGSLYNREAS